MMDGWFGAYAVIENADEIVHRSEAPQHYFAKEADAVEYAFAYARHWIDDQS
jgi:hypothetical protein